MQKLGRESAKSLALPRTQFNDLAVRFSNFTKTVAGGNGKKSVKVLDDLTSRAADFASVFNTDVNEAATLFQSGLAGETEPLRRFGIDMSAAAVTAFAYANGIAETGDKLTEAQKVQARYGILMKETNKTQGDLANTADSLANRQRFLNARWDDAKAKLGQALLPAAEDFIGFITDKGLPAVEDFSDWFNKKGIPAIKDLAKKMRPLADELLPAARDGFKGIKNFAEKALPFATGIVGAFNDMPGWVKKILIAGTAGGLTAKKLGLGKSITANLFSKGGSPANPLYVFSVNGGGGGDGGGGGKGNKFLSGVGSALKFGAISTAIAGGITLGVGSVLKKSGDENLLAAGSGGSGTTPLDMSDLDGAKSRFDKARAAGNDYLRLVQSQGQSWDVTRGKAADYFTLLHRNERTTLKTTVTGWDLAIAQQREYIENLLKIRNMHVAGGFDGGTPGQVPNHSPRPSRSTGGVTIQNQTVIAHDYKDFVQQSNRRNISAATNGMPPT